MAHTPTVGNTTNTRARKTQAARATPVTQSREKEYETAHEELTKVMVKESIANLDVSSLMGFRFNKVIPTHIENLDGIVITNTETGAGYFIGVQQRNELGESASMVLSLKTGIENRMDVDSVHSVMNRELIMKQVNGVAAEVGVDKILRFTICSADTASSTPDTVTILSAYRLSIEVVSSDGVVITPKLGNLSVYEFTHELKEEIAKNSFVADKAEPIGFPRRHTH